MTDGYVKRKLKDAIRCCNNACYYVIHAKYSRPPVVCLCGSTRFKTEYEQANLEFTLYGWIVLSVGGFMHADNLKISQETKRELDELHKRKIDMADVVFVIDLEGYVGESTESEIIYAKRKNKLTWYYSYGIAAGGQK